MKKVEYKFLSVNPEKCIGCNLCEYVCSLRTAGELNPLKSRIRIVRMHPFINLALTCKLCDDPPCVTVCPIKDTLIQSQETRVILVNEKKCDGCGWCIEACPYGAVRYDADVGSVVICDLCEGKPECMEICPVEAIEFSSSEEDIKKTWSAAYNKWIDEAKKFLHMAEGEETNFFTMSTTTMEKIDEKLRLIFEKDQSEVVEDKSDSTM